MYVVIEAFGGAEYAGVCTNEDGTNKVFDNKLEADNFARVECQKGIVVDVD